ncbi:MAG: radical SAM family heme chaperone HemW [Gammaproteobacteria bacterium]
MFLNSIPISTIHNSSFITHNYSPSISLYVHFPWCLKKCPYCDFFSSPISQTDQLNKYASSLLKDWKRDKSWLQGRKLRSIYFGGGTPSLANPEIFAALLKEIESTNSANTQDIEITLEINPGTLSLDKIQKWLGMGINRISLGVQSFQDEKLKALGRIHGSQDAIDAVKILQKNGFQNINCDLMYGLPGQSLSDALFDLNSAISLGIQHISWYQLTIEPNTAFGKNPPSNLPPEDLMAQIEEQGKELLAKHNFIQYEISAYSQKSHQSQHNVNYWLFGDYLAFGQGAHGKVTDLAKNAVFRYEKTQDSKTYPKPIRKADLSLEFMLNALRLVNYPIPKKLFSERTGLDFSQIEPILKRAEKLGFCCLEKEYFYPTKLGQTFLEDFLLMF